MKLRLFIGAFVCILLYQNLSAQNSDIFIPVNFLKAVEKGTRTLDGTPGPNYFQNHSDYKIKADFNPETGELFGEETIVYQNNSQDSLKYIVIRLYQNLFKKGSSRQTEIDPTDLNDGVNLQTMYINNSFVDISKLQYIGTNIIVPVRPAIKSKSSATIEIKWKVNLPNKTQIRMGRYDSTTCFVAYWYPQVAVYDDISGWCTESYTGLQEFYNDFSNFDVELKVPRNYIIWATAVLQNSKELFTDEINKRIANALNSDNVVEIITPSDYKNKSILKNKSQNKWHFKSENISDFAFAISDHYLWEAVGANTGNNTKQRVLMSSIFKIGSTTYQDIPLIGKKTIEKLSQEIIGIPYPYPQMTVFEGDFGMEYPMMCNDGPAADYLSRVFVTSHEIFHTYFPFLVGTNETLYGWIDEGLATFMPKIIEQEYGNKNAHYYINAYSKRTMGSINDIPLSVPSTNLNENVFMMQNYGRAAAGFYFLSDMLGTEVFRKCIKEYVSRWESKHPTPTDLLFTINTVSKQDVSWFWKAWFYEFGYADLALENVSVSGNAVKLKVLKKGAIPVPVKLLFYLEDGTVETINQSALIWKDTNEWTFDKSFALPVVKIELGDKDIPDAFGKDNIFQSVKK